MPITHRARSAVVALSGPGGATYRAFERASGHLLVEKRLHNPVEARLLEPSDFGTSISFVREEADSYVLTSGHIIHRVGTNGNVKWTWISQDQTYVLHSQSIRT